VLVNLLHNAVNFTERGPIVLELIVLERARAAVRRFKVPTRASASPKISSIRFDAFARVDATSTRRHRGKRWAGSVSAPR
jgi:signal transduction histidine kinase